MKKQFKLACMVLGVILAVLASMHFDAHSLSFLWLALGCWTSVPDYKRTNIPQMNNTVNDQVNNNLNYSWSDEASRQPDLNFLRTQNPKEIRADLALGGQLRSDTQDQVVQGALNDTAGSGVINSFNGRGAVAKDIGQMSEGLRQTRLARSQDYIKSESLEFLGLKAGDIGSIFVDDKVRDFQNQKDKVQAQQADTATNIAIGLGVANIVAGLI